MIWDDEYSGTRWRYGLTYRPLSSAAAPKGYLLVLDRDRKVPNEGYPFGTVDYTRELTATEVAAFELTFVYTIPGKV